jgi:hypothetical protein
MEGRHWKIALVVGLALLVGGCDTWFGKNKTPLPGKRLSVLSHAQTITPDPELADAQILLPPPVANPDWPQAGGYANHAMHHLKVGNVLKEVWSADIGAGHGRRHGLHRRCGNPGVGLQCPDRQADLVGESDTGQRG